MRGKLPLGLLFCGMSGFILMGAAQSLYGPAIPTYMRDFGIGQPVASLLISAHWVGAFIGVITMILRPGVMTARVSIALMAIGAALVAAELAFPVMLLGAVVLGAGYGTVAAIFNPRFLNEFGPRGPAMVGVLNAIFCIGAIGAPLVFVQLGNDPRLSFVIVAAMTLLLVPFAGRSPAVAQVQSAPLWQGLRPGILIFGGFAIGIEACVIGLGPSALVISGVSETGAAQLSSLFFVAFFLSRMSLMWIAPLIRPFSLLTVALVGEGVCMLLAATVSPSLFYVLAGAFVGLNFPAFFVCSVERLGKDPRISPIVIASGLVGGIASPILMGGLMSALGEGVVFGLLAALALATAAAALFARAEMSRSPA